MVLLVNVIFIVKLIFMPILFVSCTPLPTVPSYDYRGLTLSEKFRFPTTRSSTYKKVTEIFVDVQPYDKDENMVRI